MTNQVVVHKGRTNTIRVNLGYDVSAEDPSHITSEIRAEPSQESTLIATWYVDYETDGSDGVLTLTLDNTITSQITPNTGYMDLKRVIGGEPLAVFDEPLEVVFKGTVTE